MPAPTNTDMRNWTEFELNTVLALICKGTNLNDHVGFATKLNKALNGKRVDQDIPRKEVRKLLDYFDENHKQTMNLLKRQGVPHCITRMQKLAFARAHPPWDPTLEDASKRPRQKARVPARARKQKQLEKAAVAAKKQERDRVYDTPEARKGRGTLTTSAQHSSSSSSSNMFLTPSNNLSQNSKSSSNGPGSRLPPSPAARGGTNLPTKLPPNIPAYTHNTAAPKPIVERGYEEIGSHYASRGTDAYNRRKDSRPAPYATGHRHGHGHGHDNQHRQDRHRPSLPEKPGPGSGSGSVPSYGYGDHPYHDPNYHVRQQQQQQQSAYREKEGYQQPGGAGQQHRRQYTALPGLRDPFV